MEVLIIVYFPNICNIFSLHLISLLLGSHKSSLTTKKRKRNDCSSYQTVEVEASVRTHQKFSNEDKKILFSIVKNSPKNKANQFDWSHISNQFNQKLSRNCTGREAKNCYRANEAKANLYGLLFRLNFFLL